MDFNPVREFIRIQINLSNLCLKKSRTKGKLWKKGNIIHPQIVLIQGLDICQYTNWQISVLLDHEQHRTALKNFFPFQFSNCHNPALQALRGQRNQMPGHPMVSPGLPNMYAGNSSPSALRFVRLTRILIIEMWTFSPFPATTQVNTGTVQIQST